MDYGRHLTGEVTTADRVVRGQEKNHSGAYVFVLTPLERLERFLVLGTEGGTFYQEERELTRENAVALREVLDENPAAAVRMIVEVSQWGRAPKQSPAIFALALAASHTTGSDPLKARQLALNAVPLVCRTGGTFLEFVRYVDQFRGWGSGLRKALGAWYLGHDADSLFYQLFKYRSRGTGSREKGNRNAWTHRDVLRKAHPADDRFSGASRAIVRYVVAGREGMGDRKIERGSGVRGPGSAPDSGLADPRPPTPDSIRVERQFDVGGVPLCIQMFEELQAAETEARAANLVEKYRMPHEMVPDRYKKSKVVWEALFEHLGLRALVWNLGKLTHLGLLDSSERVQRIVGRLSDKAEIRKSRMHPVAFLNASFAYAHGQPVEAFKFSKKIRRGKVVGVREIMRWNPNLAVCEELEGAFYRAFGNVEPSGVRLDLAVDISGSMTDARVLGIPNMSARMAAAAMALVQAQTEERAIFWGFCTDYRRLDIGKDWSLAQTFAFMKALPMGNGTDCSLPFREAERAGREVDGFAIYTDNETNYQMEHPFLALQRYRKASGINARVGVMAFSATDCSIADPRDGGMMDFVGFDSAAPSVLSDFLRGKRVARKTGQREEIEED